MRQRLVPAALVFALTLALAGCGGGAQPPVTPPAETSSVSQQVILPGPAYAQREESVSGPGQDAIPPELLAGLPREEVDFLTPEQWAVYDEGVRRSRAFLLDPGCFHSADNQVPRGGPSNLPGQEGYCRYPGMAYTSYTDFYRDMRTVYTEELFRRLNTAPVFVEGDAPDQPVYRDFDGALYYLDFSGGATLTLLKDLTRFELTSQEEDQVTFDQIAYYCTPEDVGREAERPVRLCRCPVTLVREEDGWKMSDFVPVYRPPQAQQ